MNPGAFWPLDPEILFLNHGSFGSCPRPVLDFQNSLRARLEKEPVDFFVRDLEPLLDQARTALADFVGASADSLVFVPNATAGVNTVLRSLKFEPGDELLVANHEYNACRNALNFAAERSGARVVLAEVPFPLKSKSEITDAILQKITTRTRLLLIDHVTSQTGLIFPLEEIIPLLRARGIDVLVDGAHAPGMIPLRLDELGAAYYTGNCHKWLCAPKSAGFLCVQPHLQPAIRPLSISHGANSARTDRSRFQIEFAWTGTSDPTAVLSVPEAIRVLSQAFPASWEGIRARNHALAVQARQLLCEALETWEPCPADMIGSMAVFRIPDSKPGKSSNSPLYGDPAQDILRSKYNIEVPLIPWPASPRRLIRVSCQLYNELEDYKRLAAALKDLARQDLL